MYIALVGYHSKHDRSFAKERKSGYNGMQVLLFQTNAKIELDGISYNVRPNTAVVIDSSVPHSLYAMEDEYIDDWIRFQFENDERDKFDDLDIPLNMPIQLNDNTLEMMMYCCCQIFNEQNMDTHKIQHDLLSAISHYLSAIGKEYEYAKLVPYESELRELRKQIFTNPEIEYSAQTIAASMNLSVSYLNKIYRTLFGTSFMKDVFSSRMEYAQTLLTQTDKSVYEIAELCGYNSYEHFSRSFKKYSCISPQKYRENYINNNMKQEP